METPRRVQLLFDHLVTTKQRLMEVRRITVLMDANSNTVGEFFQDICDHFGLRCTSSHGPLLQLDGCTIPRLEPTSIFRDLDKIRVVGDFIRTKKKKAVATEKKEKEVRKRPFSRVEGDFCFPEETGLKREQKEVELPPRPKKKQVASINDSTSTGFRGGPQGKDLLDPIFEDLEEEEEVPFQAENVHKACPGNGTQSLPSHLIPGQPRFMSPDVTNSNSNSAWEANGEAANVNESTPPQQNGWDAWEPKH